MHSPLIGEIYVAVLAGPVEDCGTYRAAAPVPTLPASCLLEPLPRPPEPPLPPSRRPDHQNHRSRRQSLSQIRQPAATTASTDLSMNGTENWDRLPPAFCPVMRRAHRA